MCIQQCKQRWCDYRSVAGMQNTILFHLGDLDLYLENLPPWCWETSFRFEQSYSQSEE